MNNKKTKTAYSLLELSIVIVITAILVSGGLSMVTGSANNAKIKLTKERMDVIYDALGEYVLANGALPCPASITNIKSSSANYGKYIGDGSCSDLSGVDASTEAGATNLVYGMVPVRDLNLPNEIAEDGFENKIAYFVDRRFAKATTLPLPYATADSFGTAPSTPIITVREVSSGAIQTDTTDAVFVLISYGSNKSGSFAINMSSRRAISTNSNEMENDSVNTGGDFDEIIIADDTSEDMFDDIVFYKTRNNIVSDFKAYWTIPCPDGTSDTDGTLVINYDGGGDVTYYWPQAAYDQIVPASSGSECPVGYDVGVKLPTRRCGSFGIWESDTTTPCSNS